MRQEIKDFFNFWEFFFTVLRSSPLNEGAAVSFNSAVEISLRKENIEIDGDVMQN